jgi:uncharacterized membrane protein
LTDIPSLLIIVIRQDRLKKDRKEAEDEIGRLGKRRGRTAGKDKKTPVGQKEQVYLIGIILFLPALSSDIDYTVVNISPLYLSHRLKK